MEVYAPLIIAKYLDVASIGFTSSYPLGEINVKVDVNDIDSITEEDAIRAIDEIMNHEAVSKLIITDPQVSLCKVMKLLDSISSRYNIEIMMDYYEGSRFVRISISRKENKSE